MCSKEPTAGPYSEPNESSPHPSGAIMGDGKDYTVNSFIFHTVPQITMIK